MASSRFTFTAEVWEHAGAGSWHFVSLPEDVADEIEERYGHRTGGFGAVKVRVTIGGSTWSTSVFPDKSRGTYILPVKKPVRVVEDLGAGSRPRIEMAVTL
ncbi:DUF1905 domain-containing protein [Nocardia puris]|uniref:Uncharacterized protein DUF1905 n=1 Tax=Nocardia puris TaxID=208602 RepID=A0A366DPK0_9NOCA|nr:DUF1905 domain-containing protein [Nocardia puris]RBO91389.1 uncharacterized protein DUF1905 [Nocardia puris]